MDGASGDVDFNDVAVFNQTDHTAGSGFRADMSDTCTMSSAAETSVGDQCDFFAQTASHDITGRSKHFLHTGTAFRSFVADHHHITGFDFSGENAFSGFFLAFEDHSRTGMFEHFRRHAGSFDHAAVFRDIAEQNRQTALFGMGIVQRVNHFTVRCGSVFNDLADGFAGNSFLVQIELSFDFGNFLEDGGNAAAAFHVFHMVIAGRGNFADIRSGAADFVDFAEIQFDARFRSDGESMQNGIGTAAHCHIQSERIVERLFISDVFGKRTAFQSHFHNPAGGGFPEFFPFGAGRGNGAVAGKSQTDRFGQTVHAVGGEHAGAGTASRTGMFFKVIQTVLIQFTDFVFGNPFENRDQVAGLAVAVHSGFHGAAGCEDGRNVETHGAHQHTGSDFVAVRDADQRVKRMSGRHGFERVGDDFTAGQRKFHAGVSHGNAVADRDGVELERNAARLADFVADQFADFLEMCMTRNNRDIRIANSDKRLGKILLFQSGCTEQSTMRSTLGPLLHDVTSHFFTFFILFFLRNQIVFWHSGCIVYNIARFLIFHMEKKKMFDNLTGKLQDALKKLRGQAVLSEANIADAMKEIRDALIDADVNLEIADEFIATVKQACLGADVLRSVSPGQQAVKIVYDKMVEFMGEAEAPLASGGKPTVVMMVGLHGSGKTTTTAKLALQLKNKGKRVLMTACDVYRPAAIDQLEILGRDTGIPVHAERGNPDVCSIATNAIAEARDGGFDYVLLDTAGRLQIDTPMVQELVRLKQISGAQEILLVADAALGQQAVSVAKHFNEALVLTGVVLTKLDGDARGGAAFSIRKVTGCPIKFVGIGEKLENLDVFHPDRMASRILGMGDIVSLVEQAAEKFDREETERLQQKLRKNEFDLNDFLGQLRQMSKLGGIEGILKFLPGGNKLAELPDLDPKQFKRMEAIICSMTKKERANVDMIDLSRRKRISRGCGCPLEEVNRLIKQFSAMKNMMKRNGLLSRMMSGGSMPAMGLGMPGFRAPTLRGSNYTPPKKKRKKR